MLDVVLRLTILNGLTPCGVRVAFNGSQGPWRISDLLKVMAVRRLRSEAEALSVNSLVNSEVV